MSTESSRRPASSARRSPRSGMLRRHLPRLGCEPPGLGDGRRAPRAPALDQREGPGDHRRHQRGCDDRRAGLADAGLGAEHSLSSPVLGVPARLEELAFDTRELPRLAGLLRRRRQPRAAVEIGRPRVRVSSQERAAVVSCRRVRSSSRSSANHPRNRGHSRISASWAISAESSPTTSSRAPPAARAPRSPHRRPRPPGSAPPAGPAGACPRSSRPAR